MIIEVILPFAIDDIDPIIVKTPAVQGLIFEQPFR
jgi:hypothetical protein